MRELSPVVWTDADFKFSLIAKWKKTGYEKLCCVRCIQTRVRTLLISPLSLTHTVAGYELPRLDVHMPCAESADSIGDHC